MKKRTFTYVLALITIVCLLASSASAAAPDTLNGDTIQRRLLPKEENTLTGFTGT